MTIPSDKPVTFILAMGANTIDENGNRLLKANDDAQKFADTIAQVLKLEEHNKCIIKDVKQEQFKRNLEKLQILAQPRDTVFIYFSGHGTKLPDSNEDEVYDDKYCYDEAFVVNNNFGTGIHKVRDDFFVKQVNKIPTNNIITTVDFCFSGGVLRGTKNCLNVKSKNWSFSHNKEEPIFKSNCPVSDMKKLKGKVYMASKENEIAWEFDNGGIFTTFFVKNIRIYKKFDKAFEITAKQVRDITSLRGCDQLQQPQRRP
ncbi:caspase family protein [Thiotrichales bacterium HSG1]|nr:caspase family protein [Thiotrichales bacterium HSG1]